MKFEYKLLLSNIIVLILTISSYFKIHNDYLMLEYSKLFNNPIDYTIPQNQILFSFNSSNYQYILLIASLFLMFLVNLDLCYNLYNKMRGKKK